MGEALRFGDIIRTYDNAEYLVLDRVAPMAPKRMTASIKPPSLFPPGWRKWSSGPAFGPVDHYEVVRRATLRTRVCAVAVLISWRLRSVPWHMRRLLRKGRW